MSYMIKGVEIGQMSGPGWQGILGGEGVDGSPAPPLDGGSSGGSSDWQSGLTSIVSAVTQGAGQGLAKTLTSMVPGAQRPAAPPPQTNALAYVIPGLAILGIGGVAVAKALKARQKVA